jgi:O-antigen ligase
MNTSRESSLLGGPLKLRFLPFAFWIIWSGRDLLGTIIFGQGNIKGAFLGEALMFPLIVLALCRLALHRDVWLRELVSLPPLCIIAFVTWAGLSFYWTEGRILVGAFFWVSLVVDLLAFATCMGGTYYRRESVRSAILGIVAGGLLQALFFISQFHATFVDRSFGDSGLNINLAGDRIALAIICLVWLWTTKVVRSRLIAPLVCIVLVVGLLFTTSKTPLIATGFAVATFLIFQNRIRLGVRAGVAAVVMVAAGVGFAQVRPYFVEYLEQGQLETVSGRTDAWDAVWEGIHDAPVVGHGFASTRDVLQLKMYGDVLLAHGHNELLTEWFTLGIVGVAIVGWQYWFVFRNRKRSLLKTLIPMWLQYVILRGLVEAGNNGDAVFAVVAVALFSSAVVGRESERFDPFVLHSAAKPFPTVPIAS